jgi:hypothetical protein
MTLPKISTYLLVIYLLISSFFINYPGVIPNVSNEKIINENIYSFFNTQQGILFSIFMLWAISNFYNWGAGGRTTYSDAGIDHKILGWNSSNKSNYSYETY